VDDCGAQVKRAGSRARRRSADAERSSLPRRALHRLVARARGSPPAIVALRSHAEAIRDAELARALARLNE